MKNHELVLIVDDNRVSNFFNKRIIEATMMADKVITMENGKAALDFINPKKSLEPYPTLIFLDLKMPKMNGWEFLEAYNNIERVKECDIVVMYEDGLLPEEEMKLSQYEFVKTTVNKILTSSSIIEIFEENNEVMHTVRYIS